MTAVGFGDRGHDCETEARAAARSRARRVGTPEALERTRRLFRAHARAVVLHLDDRVGLRLGDPNVDGSRRRRMGARVLEQVREHLPQPELVAVHHDRGARLVADRAIG